MDNENHKKTWNNFTKFVLWGTVAVVLVLVLMALFLFRIFLMKIGSISENQKIEKRIAITPEIAKKYISLGFDVHLSENYGTHLGITDDEYKKIGVKFSKDEKEIINYSNVIVQLGLLSDDKSALLKEGQTLIGVLNPYNNKEKLDQLVKKKVKLFSLEFFPRITRAQSMDILSSQANLAGYKAVIESFANFEKAIPMMMTAAGTFQLQRY